MNLNSRYCHLSKRRRFVQFIYRRNVLMVIFVALIGAAYIAEANVVSSHGIQIKLLQNQIIEERRDYGQLEIQVATSQSMNALETRIQSLKMVPLERPVYITVHGGAVALR